MRAGEPIRVEFYSGGRAEEVPRAVWVGSERVSLAEVVEDRLEETHPERSRRRRIVVETALGERWVLIQEEAAGDWRLERQGR